MLARYAERSALREATVPPEAVAEAALWLAGERSAHTTGCVITVGGGRRGFQGTITRRRIEMIPLSDLKKAAAEGLVFLKQQDDVEEAEVFVSSNGVLLTRLNYTSHIPCNGVEEPKSLVNYGVGVQAVFRGDGRACGSRGSGRSRRTSRWRGCGRRWRRRGRGRWRTRSSARWRGRRASSGRSTDYHDPKLMEMKDADLVDAGWRVVNGGLRVFETSESLMSLVDRPEKLTELGLIIGGDTTILQERMAIASHAMPEVQTDESTLIMSFITSMVEREESKGSGYGASTTLAGSRRSRGARRRGTRSRASAACGCRRATIGSCSGARR